MAAIMAGAKSGPDSNVAKRLRAAAGVAANSTEKARKAYEAIKAKRAKSPSGSVVTPQDRADMEALKKALGVK